jgi:hypothetical protein
MAYDGELVRMENGRWARFQTYSVVNGATSSMDPVSMLVAVELDEQAQVLLNQMEESLEGASQASVTFDAKEFERIFAANAGQNGTR